MATFLTVRNYSLATVESLSRTQRKRFESIEIVWRLRSPAAIAGDREGLRVLEEMSRRLRKTRS
jgi:hypothetical protein